MDAPYGKRRVTLLGRYTGSRRYWVASGWTLSVPGFAHRLGLKLGPSGWLYRGEEAAAALIVEAEGEEGATINAQSHKIYWPLLDGTWDEYAAAMM